MTTVKITAKQKLLNELVSRDRSGATQNLHDKLVALGFKWKDRAQTMMYYVKGRSSDLTLVAIRPGLMSFPKNFWLSRPEALKNAMGRLPERYHIPLEGVPFTSSQFSAGQLALETATLTVLLNIVREIVISEAKAAGASTWT